MVVSVIFYFTTKWKKPLPEDVYTRLTDEETQIEEVLETPMEEVLEDAVEAEE